MLTMLLFFLFVLALGSMTGHYVLKGLAAGRADEIKRLQVSTQAKHDAEGQRLEHAGRMLAENKTENEVAKIELVRQLVETIITDGEESPASKPVAKEPKKLPSGEK